MGPEKEIKVAFETVYGHGNVLPDINRALNAISFSFYHLVGGSIGSNKYSLKYDPE